jgi:hypothetical protein
MFSNVIGCEVGESIWANATRCRLAAAVLDMPDHRPLSMPATRPSLPTLPRDIRVNLDVPQFALALAEPLLTGSMNLTPGVTGTSPAAASSVPLRGSENAVGYPTDGPTDAATNQHKDTSPRAALEVLRKRQKAWP